MVRLAVIRVERRVGHLVVVVAGHADEKVEVAVAVHVGERRRARVLGDRDAGSVGPFLERPVALVVEETRGAEGVGDEEIGIAVAVDVSGGDARRGDAVRRVLREAGLLRDVGEMAAPVIRVEDGSKSVRHEEVLGAIAVVVEDRDAGTRPDIRDQMIRELVGRVVARRTETGLGRGVVESGGDLGPIRAGRDHRDGEARRRRSARLFGHADVGGPLDAHSAGSEAADGEAHAAGGLLDAATILVRRFLDAEIDIADPFETGPGPGAERLEPLGIRGCRLAAPKSPARRLAGVPPAHEAFHPGCELVPQAVDRGVVVRPDADGGRDRRGENQEDAPFHARGWYRVPARRRLLAERTGFEPVIEV